MASSMEFVNYVLGQLDDSGEITSKRLFGEYGIYIDGIFCGAICDNQLFIKDSEEGRAVLREVVYGEMYPGAKPSLLIENLQDRETLTKLMMVTKQVFGKQSPKKKKKT